MQRELETFIRSEKNLAEEFVRELRPSDKIILCGGGCALYWYYKFLDYKSVRPDYIIDKNCACGEKFGIPLVSHDFILSNLDLDICRFVITAPKYREEIINDIQSIYGDVKIYSFEAEIYYTFLRDIAKYKQYLLDNLSNLQDFYNVLEDEKSKETLRAFVKGRVSGNQKYFIDCMVPNQYFPEDIISLNEREIIVEAGSNDGKTLLEIIDRTKGSFEKLFCFEPDKECIKILEKIIGSSNKPVQLIKKGVGEKKDKIYFKTDYKHGTSRITDSKDFDYFIDITSLDEELGETAISYIKMDIEGMELDCLKGAKTIISKYSPKLAVCVYHNQEDILEIPKYIRTINPNYKFYLRHHNWGGTETVLYAI